MNILIAPHTCLYLLFSFKSILFFRTVLGSQHNWEDKEISDIPCPTHAYSFFHCQHPTVKVVHLAKLTNLYWYNIITQYLCFSLEYTLNSAHFMGLDKRVMKYNHHHGIIRSSITTLEILFYLSIHPAPSLEITDIVKYKHFFINRNTFSLPFFVLNLDTMSVYVLNPKIAIINVLYNLMPFKCTWVAQSLISCLFFFF